MLLVVVLLGVLVVAPAGAQQADPTRRQSEIEDQLTDLRQRYAEADAAETELLAAYEASRQRTRELDARVAELDGRVAAVQRELDAARARLAPLERRHAKVAARLVRTRAELAESRALLRDQAVAAYMGTGAPGRLATLVLRSDTIEKASLTSSYAGAVAHQQNELIAQREALEDELADLEDAAADAARSARRQRDAVAARAAEAEQARAEQAAARDAAAAEVHHQADLVARARGQKAAFDARIAELERESDAITALLRARQRPRPSSPSGPSAPGRPPAPSGHGVLAVPIGGAAVTSGYGPRVHPIFHTVRMHTGVDFGATAGTPIRAAGAGEVVWAGERGGYGLATVIDHGDGLATLYGHQSRIAVSVGQRVARGQVIGAVGSTGYATGPHLHFEVRVDGAPVDPMGYL